MAGKDGSVGRSHPLPTTSRRGGGWIRGQLSPSSLHTQTVVNQHIVIHVAEKFIGKKTQSARRRIRTNGLEWEGLSLCSCSRCPGTRGALSILPAPLHTVTSAQSMGKARSPAGQPFPQPSSIPGASSTPPGTAANTIEQILVLLLHRDEQTPGCSRQTWNSLYWAQEQLPSRDHGTAGQRDSVIQGLGGHWSCKEGPGGHRGGAVAALCRSRILHHWSIPPVAL